MTKGDTVLLRCVEDGSSLTTVTTPESGVMAVCLTCGAAWKYEEIAEHAAGVIPGRFSQEMLVNLRDQTRLGREQGG